MFIEYIERLRREPKEVRRRAVFFWTVAIVGVIVLLYGLYLLVDSAIVPSDTRSANLARPYDADR